MVSIIKLSKFLLGHVGSWKGVYIYLSKTYFEHCVNKLSIIDSKLDLVILFHWNELETSILQKHVW